MSSALKMKAIFCLLFFLVNAIWVSEWHDLCQSTKEMSWKIFTVHFVSVYSIHKGDSLLLNSMDDFPIIKPFIQQIICLKENKVFGLKKKTLKKIVTKCTNCGPTFYKCRMHFILYPFEPDNVNFTEMRTHFKLKGCGKSESLKSEFKFYGFQIK